MSPTNRPLPVPDPEDRGRPSAPDFDPTFDGAAVLTILPNGCDAELARRIQSALGEVVNNDDDPPVVILTSAEIEPSSETLGNDPQRHFLPARLVPLVVKIAEETIGYLSREAREQQRREHAAAKAHQESVEKYHKRAENWRKKTFG